MDIIVEIAHTNGGLVTTTQVMQAGIPRARLSDMVKDGTLERVQRGVYCLSNTLEDEFLSTQLRFPKGIYSDGTALYLHDYTDQTPFRLTMTFPRSYHATKAREAGIEVRTCADDVIELGLAEVKTTYGNTVRAYDLERTLCDLLRGHSVVNVQIVNPAMRAYFLSGTRNLQRLLSYSRSLGVEKKVLNYLEVLI